ncbi:MAG TPA: type II secretion system protein GspD [Deltaproteobacteria bacterium]|nr:type II secretion system protein GspD [Candidatus Binatota bacterium]HIL13123.1 type II secretion system protein GspD [Deltaproteobacteria bacterium]
MMNRRRVTGESLVAGRLVASALVVPFTAALMVVALSGSARAQAPAQGQGQRSITIDFDNVELPTFIKFIARVTGRNFVFSDKIEGTVNVVSPTPVSRDEAEAVFHSVLAVRGLTTIEDGVVTRIIPLRDALAAGAALSSGSQLPSGYATRLLPLKHVDALDLLPVLEPLVSKQGSLTAYAQTNTLILSESSGNLSRLEALVLALDAPVHEKIFDVISLDHAVAAVMTEQITTILTNLPSAPAKGKPGESSEPDFRIVADERTNSLVVTATPLLMGRIRTLAERLDSPLRDDEQRVHVYRVKHANAEDLVLVVLKMLAGGIKSAGAARKPGATGATARARSFSGNGLTDAVSVTADPATNSIIINASPHDHRVLVSLLEDLDVTRPQVFVEAIIVEISLERSRAIGFDFQGGGDIGDGVGLARSNLANLNSALLNPGLLGGLILAAASDRSIELPDGTVVPAQVALFQALASDTDLNVLSAPTLLTMDNEQAEILVGKNVPFVTGRGVDVSAVSNVFTTVERRDVGIKLKLTPQVTDGDMVVLKVSEEVSALVKSSQLDANTVGPTTTVRSASTTVSVKDGHTAVIGGLISDSLEESTSKVPLLSRIPLLGNLFKHRASTSSKVNLVVFLTPHIIRSDADLAQATKRSKNKFKEAMPESVQAHPLPGDSPTDSLREVPIDGGLDAGSDDNRTDNDGYVFPLWPSEGADAR